MVELDVRNQKESGSSDKEFLKSITSSITVSDIFRK
jgi:hypothetical protein